MVNINDFPSYVGFGKINRKTFSESKEMVSVDYFFDEVPVHRVSYFLVYGNWEIKDIYDDTLKISSSPDLKMTVMMYFNRLDCKSNPIFNFVRDKICSRGNIYFQDLASMNDKGAVESYFPAGRLVILRLPIFFDEEGSSKVEVLIDKIPYLEEEHRPLVKICDAYNTSLLLPEENGNTIVIPIFMIEYIVPLASLLDVVDWICNNNLLSHERIFRMIIQDSTTKTQHQLQTFGSVENDDSEIYSILFKGRFKEQF